MNKAIPFNKENITLLYSKNMCFMGYTLEQALSILDKYNGWFIIKFGNNLGLLNENYKKVCIHKFLRQFENVS